ncbi:cytochrome c4 [Marinobacter daepoensis]|uniref:Cytochrome c4 n=1 Tax=Marinobacter daepoensis TaxID=262077 RepID=A0ABS3BBD7_9GAMM|nr:c-type cytochrome [Marinobacter daepoensis]MBN7769171.1 cytochrome c4 [Marinobacter daepoensis]MBY6032216.1 cytochrome c4 [Marinobacter daepoensis]MBY6077861.1 cytochrome c4 [Marinobacter daepoensis]
MKKLPVTLAALGLVTYAGMAVSAPAGDASRGKEVANLCVACHQPDGSGMNLEGGESWPGLAGMNAEYFAKQIRDIKQGTRLSPTMAPFASMLDDQKTADVAAYYSQLEPTAGKGGENADPATLKRGQQLAEQGDWSKYIVSCKSCHGPGNRGAGEAFPGIAGQHAGYIEAQLKAWKTGARKNDPQDLMGSIARRMSDDDIHAVAVWLASQKPGNN